MKIKILLLVACFLSIILNECGCTREHTQNTDGLTVISVAGKQLFVEIADTPAKRKKGLMYRETLPENQGMLFIFEKEQQLSFWMKNTRIPLSLAFISKKGVITQIVKLIPFDERPHTSEKKVMYVLEVNQGWFFTNHIKIGDRITIPDVIEHFNE
jgi:uncharacterized membrane protein (UPF0127 family)